MHYVLLSVGIPTVYLVAKYLTGVIRTASFRRRFDWQEEGIEWLFVAVVCALVLPISHQVGQQGGTLVAIGLGIVLGASLISYHFIVYPVLILWRRGTYERWRDYEVWLSQVVGRPVNIRILDGPHDNAYALGVLSPAKVILVGKSLRDKLSPAQLKSLLLHEYGHLKFHHLRLMYLSNVACCALSIVSASHFYPLFNQSEYAGWFVFLHGALFGILYVVVPGLVQRRLERQADRYAASVVGAEAYSDMLLRLNEIANGALEKKQINYPTLQQRLQDVR